MLGISSQVFGLLWSSPSCPVPSPGVARTRKLPATMLSTILARTKASRCPQLIIRPTTKLNTHDPSFNHELALPNQTRSPLAGVVHFSKGDGRAHGQKTRHWGGRNPHAWRNSEPGRNSGFKSNIGFEVSQWRWEVWNEMWGIDYKNHYLPLFNASSAALKAVHPSLQVGGPATMRTQHVQDLISDTKALKRGEIPECCACPSSSVAPTVTTLNKTTGAQDSYRFYIDPLLPLRSKLHRQSTIPRRDGPRLLREEPFARQGLC